MDNKVLTPASAAAATTRANFRWRVLIWLLIGGILLVIARVMEEAARLAEENAAFV